jgi:hypothetical protein
MKNIKAVTLLLMLFILIIINNNCFAQKDTNMGDSLKTRKISFSFDAGYSQMLSYGVGLQLTPTLELAFKLGHFYHPALLNMTSPNFVFINTNYYFNKTVVIINKISITAGLSFVNTDAKVFGFSAGYESTKNTVINFHYSVGFASIISKKYSNETYPGINAGINFNF